MFDIYILSCLKTEERLLKLMANNAIRHSTIKVIRNEITINNISIAKEQMWNDMSNALREVQEDNLKRCGQSLRDNLMPPYRQLRDSEISIYTKHFQALEDFSRSRNHYALILEDDIKVDLDDINTLRQILMAHEFDFCDICESPGLSVESGSLVKIGNYECRLEKLKPPRTRNACSYIVNKKTAMQFLGEDYHYILPFDWSFSYFLIKYKLKTIWVDGLPIGHGSQIGLYNSTSKL